MVVVSSPIHNTAGKTGGGREGGREGREKERRAKKGRGSRHQGSDEDGRKGHRAGAVAPYFREWLIQNAKIAPTGATSTETQTPDDCEHSVK